MTVFRSPAEYYLKYLVSHPDLYTDKEIESLLLDRGLNYRGPEYTTRVRGQTIAPIPFRPYDEEHLTSQCFISKHRIYSQYHRDAATREADSILANAAAREFVESMLLVRATPELISRGVLRVGADLFISPEGVKRYRHYYWNVNLLGFTEMRALLTDIGIAGGKSFEKAFRKDSRRLVAELPYNPVSAMIAQAKMGITPVGMDYTELLDRLKFNSLLKCYQFTMDDGPFSSTMARDYIQIAQAATEMLEKSAHPEEKLLERFKSLQLELDATPIPNIKQLSEGRHTTDFQAVPEHEEDLAEMEATYEQ